MVTEQPNRLLPRLAPNGSRDFFPRDPFLPLRSRKGTRGSCGPAVLFFVPSHRGSPPSGRRRHRSGNRRHAVLQEANT